ncbi:MAG: hypothetical protein LBB61_01020 [Treponema sp.]|nr:hypothetical protein [Treponema sp.]
MKPKKTRYDRLETDECWIYRGGKKNKVWLIYAYQRRSGEITAYVWGKRNLKTARKLKKRIRRLWISYERMATADWDGFVAAYAEDRHGYEKEYTIGIGGITCRLRHRVRRAFRKPCSLFEEAIQPWKSV